MFAQVLENLDYVGFLFKILLTSGELKKKNWKKKCIMVGRDLLFHLRGDVYF